MKLIIEDFNCNIQVKLPNLLTVYNQLDCFKELENFNSELSVGYNSHEGYVYICSPDSLYTLSNTSPYTSHSGFEFIDLMISTVYLDLLDDEDIKELHDEYGDGINISDLSDEHIAIIDQEYSGFADTVKDLKRIIKELTTKQND